MPGYTFYNLQYSTSEQEIDEFRAHHQVPLYHAPGLDLMDDMLGTAAFTACMDLFVSPASTCSDIAGSMGVKSYRSDLIHLPENLGQDYIPWYEDQYCRSIPWGMNVRRFHPGHAGVAASKQGPPGAISEFAIRSEREQN